MKHLVSFIFLLSCALSLSAKDRIMLRSGLEMSVKVVQVGNEQIIYKESDDEDASEQALDIKDVYMISYETRGIVYITQDGKRVSEDAVSTKRIKEKAPQWVYLVEGKVYPAYNLQILEDQIVFDRIVGVKKGFLSNKVEMASMALKKEEVFLIKYLDGSKDIITEFKPKEPQKNPEPETEVEEPQEEEQQVIFHNVKSGDTLAKLAKRYNVTIEDIKEWNDLPEKLKPTARLQTDMQLMLYVEIVKAEK